MVTLEMTKNGQARTPEQLREHYEIEKELASRLRSASKEERRDLYHVVYDERSRRIPHHPLVMRATDPNAQARAAQPQVHLLKPFVSPETVFMEIGVGDGSVSLEMAKHVSTVYALDVSDELVHQVMSQPISTPSNFEFCLFNGLELPVPAGTVDVAYSNDVLEHLHPEDAHEQLTSLLNVLKRGGKFICITPNRLSGPHDVSRHFDEVATGFHLKEYTIGEMYDLFRRVGFSRVQAFVTMHGHHLTPVMSVLPFIAVEKLMGRIPRPYGKKIASILAAVKVVAEK